MMSFFSRVKRVFCLEGALHDVVLRRHASLGDVVSVEPVVRALKKAGCRHVAVDVGHFQAVFEGNPYVSPLEKLRWPIADFELMGTYENKLETLREQVYLDVCRVSLPQQEQMPRLYLTDQEKTWGKAMLGDGKWVVIDAGYPMVHPDGQPNFLTGKYQGEIRKWRRAFWKAEDWAPLILGLKDMGFKIVQIGNRPTAKSLPHLDLDLQNCTNLRQMFSVIHAASVFLGLESGPMHVAQALGLNGVAIFNPRSPHESLLPLGSRIVPVYRNSGDKLGENEILGIVGEMSL